MIKSKITKTKHDINLNNDKRIIKLNQNSFFSLIFIKF